MGDSAIKKKRCQHNINVDMCCIIFVLLYSCRKCNRPMCYHRKQQLLCQRRYVKDGIAALVLKENRETSLIYQSSTGAATQGASFFGERADGGSSSSIIVVFRLAKSHSSYCLPHRPPPTQRAMAHCDNMRSRPASA